MAKEDHFKDLGLSYEEAAHGIQSVKAAELTGAFGAGPLDKYQDKHVRTGIDLSKVDMHGLACLLIDKKLITQEEYLEYLRLAANTELAQEEAIYRTVFR